MESLELWEYANLYLNGIPTYRLIWKKTGVEPEEALRLYRATLRGIPCPEPKSIRLPVWGKDKASNSRHGELIEGLKRQFSGLSGTLILMGSLADNTSTGYSDVDLAYILQDEEFATSAPKIRRALREVARIILSFDHLQHHGVFVIPEGMAVARSPLPPSAFHGAVVLQGKNEVAIGGWEGSYKANLEPIVNKCVALAHNPAQRPRNLYGIKLLLSQLMLLPSLFLSAKSKDVPKSESFALVKEMLPEARAPLDLATEIRASWKRPDSRAFKMGLALSRSPWDFAFALRRFFRPTRRLLDALDEEFYQGVGQMARRMRDALD
ncbi:MAG: nucleotidyltransferase domain-containing protein [candidate division WOR-3 bacterium]